jgi:hypothetical protein
MHHGMFGFGAFPLLLPLLLPLAAVAQPTQTTQGADGAAYRRLSLALNSFALLEPALELTAEYRPVSPAGLALVGGVGREKPGGEADKITFWSAGVQGRLYPVRPPRQTEPFALLGAKHLSRTVTFSSGAGEATSTELELAAGGGAKYTALNGFLIEAIALVEGNASAFGMGFQLLLGWSF